MVLNELYKEQVFIMEEWKDVLGYEGLYQVSSYGNVKRDWRSGNHRSQHEASLMVCPKCDGKKGFKVLLGKIKSVLSANLMVEVG